MKIMKSRMITCYINKTLFYTRGIGTTSMPLWHFPFVASVFEGKYGAACYQKSAWHLQQFAHPGETWIKPSLWKFGLFRSLILLAWNQNSQTFWLFIFWYTVSTYSIYIFELWCELDSLEVWKPWKHSSCCFFRDHLEGWIEHCQAAMVDQLLLIHASSYSNIKTKMKAYGTCILRYLFYMGCLGKSSIFPSMIQSINHRLLFLHDSRNPLVFPSSNSIHFHLGFRITTIVMAWCPLASWLYIK